MRGLLQAVWAAGSFAAGHRVLLLRGHAWEPAIVEQEVHMGNLPRPVLARSLQMFCSCFAASVLPYAELSFLNP